jgi:hypothetical protein
MLLNISQQSKEPFIVMSAKNTQKIARLAVFIGIAHDLP